ncbi:hypothetical protein ONE63_001076 [Megalurothrips usitatus]|uniref:Uncharacterized protein n=1 Tax=Megalurothrips usitatus TaxID=439358 RepID=A0AAV7XBZ7_9NEOP|nr:hypothetical protein ONE63_001076 [Megalurothrips usitatus]
MGEGPFPVQSRGRGRQLVVRHRELREVVSEICEQFYQKHADLARLVHNIRVDPVPESPRQRPIDIPPNLVNDVLTFFKGESGETPAFGGLTAGMDVRFTAYITGLPPVEVMRVKIVPAPATGPTAGDTDAAKSLYQNLIKEVIDSVPESPVAAVNAIKECWYKYFCKAETPETIQGRAYLILKPDTLDAVWSFEPVKLDGVITFQQLLQNFSPISTTNGTRYITHMNLVKLTRKGFRATLQHLIVFEMCITLFGSERRDEVDIDDFMRLVVMLLQSTNTLRWVRPTNVVKNPYPTHGSATSIWLSVKPGDSLFQDQFKNRKMLKFLTKHVTYNRKPLHCSERIKLEVTKAAADTTSDLVAAGHVVIGSSLLSAFVTFAAKKLAGASKEGALCALAPLLETLRYLVVDKDIMTPTGYLLKEMGITGTTMDLTQVTTLKGMSRDQLSPYTSSDEEESATEEADLRRFGPRPKRARKEMAASNPPPGSTFRSRDKSKKDTSVSDLVSSSDTESDN